MRAKPALPTVSAVDVAKIGAATVAADRRRVAIVGQMVGPVARRLTVREDLAGVPHLVDVETGERLGICASRAVGERTAAFFAR